MNAELRLLNVWLEYSQTHSFMYWPWLLSLNSNELVADSYSCGVLIASIAAQCIINLMTYLYFARISSAMFNFVPSACSAWQNKKSGVAQCNVSLAIQSMGRALHILWWYHSSESININSLSMHSNIPISKKGKKFEILEYVKWDGSA